MRLIVGLILVTTSLSSLADCSSVNCSAVKITRMVVNAEGDIGLGTSGNESNLSCDAGSSGYITLKKMSSNFDHLYSLILSAHVTNHPVTIRTTNASTCEVVYLVSDK